MLSNIHKALLSPTFNFNNLAFTSYASLPLKRAIIEEYINIAGSSIGKKTTGEAGSVIMPVKEWGKVSYMT
jgi:hypothetical protein